MNLYLKAINVRFYIFLLNLIQQFSVGTFVFAFGFQIEALIVDPKGFLAHFLAVQYVLWFVGVSLL